VQVRQARLARLCRTPQKQRLIDDLMKGFYRIFNRVGAEYRNCAGGQTSSSQSTAQLGSALNGRSSSYTTNNKRKLADCEEIPEEDDENQPLKRPKLPNKLSHDSLPASKFACPFHQHNPQKYGVNLQSSDADYRCCAGPGWRSVARIK
jgi:hypothetical protein